MIWRIVNKVSNVAYGLFFRSKCQSRTKYKWYVLSNTNHHFQGMLIIILSRFDKSLWFSLIEKNENWFQILRKLHTMFWTAWWDTSLYPQFYTKLCRWDMVTFYCKLSVPPSTIPEREGERERGERERV